MRNTHTVSVSVVAVLLLLSTLHAENHGVDSAARPIGCQFQGEADKVSSQKACIVDLKPGDVRLFAPAVTPPGRLYRWLEIRAASIGTQYVFAKNRLGTTTANQQQYQLAIRGRFKFDADGRFSLNAGLYTGANFIGGFDNTGLGRGKAQSNLYLKQLYLSVMPFDGLELQYGGLDIWHDESTDITGYAYNGYIEGERISIKRPRELFLDEISVACGYVGDLTAPNVLRHLHRLTESNFHRFMLRKNVGERAGISADYAFQSGTQTWREAIRIRVTELRAVDVFHAEVYQVSSIHPGYGFAAYGEKTLLPRFTLGGGYASIDRLVLNSDRYGPGKRLFLTSKIPINKAVGMLVFATQAMNHATGNVPQQRLDIGLYYNLLYHLRKTGIF